MPCAGEISWPPARAMPGRSCSETVTARERLQHSEGAEGERPFGREGTGQNERLLARGWMRQLQGRRRFAGTCSSWDSTGKFSNKYNSFPAAQSSENITD